MDEFREVVSALWLTDDIMWDISLYVLFLLNFVLMFMHPSGDSMATSLSMLILVAIVIDKVRGFGYMFDPGSYSRARCHEEIFIGTYLIRVVMFAAPLTIAGRTTKPSIRPIAIIAGLGGGAYMFIRWFMEQRDVNSTRLLCSWLTLDFALQSGGAALILARVALRDRLLLGRVHRHIPVAVLGELAADQVEIDVA